VLGRCISFRYFALSFLGFITLFALLPWQPQGPFDARDWSLIEGLSLTMPWWVIFIEPFAAFGQIIAGSADFRLTALAFAFWSGVSSWCLVFFRHGVVWRRFVSASMVSLFVMWCVCTLILLFSFVHFPGWQLQNDDVQWLAADLQTHTIGSHDGFVRVDENLRWHEQRGYDVISVTEHNDPQGSFYAKKLAHSTDRLVVISGIEVANEFNGFLLGLGLNSKLPVKVWQRGEKKFSRRFSQEISQQHGGAVISLAWRLSPEDVETLVNDGVHAFEIMNAGHPNIPDSVRNEMLRMEREGRIRLVSSSDWHGWSGASRTWTLFRVPDAEKMSHQERAEAIVKLLREGSSSDVIPIVAGYQGDVSLLHTVFSPLVETARYAAELSPLRLLSWWLWAIVIGLLAHGFKAYQLAPLPAFTSIGLLSVGAVLLWRGWELYQIKPEGDVMLSKVTQEFGMMNVYAAVPLLCVGFWLFIRTFHGRSQQSC